MLEEIKNQILKSTKSAGVYQFLDDANKALYVGKAKNLRNRLKNYLDQSRLGSRIRIMTSKATKLEIITTKTEADALLLECNLIKKLMPRYNILLRDDKSFANIMVDTSHQFPSISRHRGKKIIKGKYFGPFASGLAVGETIDHLKKSFLLRSCSDNEFKNRKKPCLEYQIKRCSAPCVSLVSAKEYDKLITQVLNFLSGKSSNLQEELAQKMQEFSNDLEFEQSRILRDRIRALSAIQAKQHIHLPKDENIDFIALTRNENLACIVVSFFRNGNNYGSKPYFLNIANDDKEEEILNAFLEQFYSDNALPDFIINNILDCRIDLGIAKLKITNPKQGLKFNLLQDYLKLATEHLNKKLNTQIKDLEMLIEIKNLFDLPKIPQRIEIYDNSHISGSFAVGAFVVSGKDGFIKSSYRKFNIKLEELDKKDDTGFLKQVLARRFKKSEEQIIPDLIIIDGGKGQLSAAHEVFSDLSVDVNFVAMSKGKDRNAGEEFFHRVGKSSFTLDKNSPLMFYLQRLRDEAHRFAIGFNRAKRAKAITKSELDEIPNIGPKRKSLLLNHFGSVSAIKQASEEDLTMVKGINKNFANKIVAFFG
ncbi:MAG: excinuclease ABC subunit C [Lentimonas sp.]|jgi:excinuclease ABC subunit C